MYEFMYICVCVHPYVRSCITIKCNMSFPPFLPPPCRSSVSSVQPQPAAVHALNILRALYRDSRLADFVVPFISDGVTIAIQGFSATSWPVCLHTRTSIRCAIVVVENEYTQQCYCMYMKCCSSPLLHTIEAFDPTYCLPKFMSALHTQVQLIAPCH